ncbi:MAG: dTMP kinase [Acidimicrobiaceae bacterium]|nr:dTMP kinase [Acidimicrobiia bacterium]MCY4494280.1 dTMP kinase [Acidimicrobiaceae bacterium]
MSGRLIVLEGIDGSGKSTQVRRLAQGHDFDVTFQFGATEVGSAIRSILLDPSNRRLDDRTEAMLIIADKAQHVREIVRPALDSGRTVVSDRYCASTLAYQGYGRGLDRRLLDEMMQFATQGLAPDLTVLLDIDIAAARGRLGDQRDRIERAGIEFYQRVRDGYLKLAAQHPDSWVVIDAAGSVDEVAARVASVVDDWLRENP